MSATSNNMTSPFAPSITHSAQQKLWQVSVALPLALLLTLALLFFMQQLISETFVPKKITATVLTTVHMNENPKIETREKPLEKPAPPESQPKVEYPQFVGPDAVVERISMTVPTQLGSGEGPVINTQEGEPIPYLRVAPIYPSRPLQRNIEGYVDLGFAITKTGATDAITVLGSQPSGTFDRAAIRAVKKWKYKPQVAQGVAVRKEGVSTRVVFKITK